MECVYPAIFHENSDGSYTITYPDLPGCISEGKSLGNAMGMAQSALTEWIEYLTDKAQPIPEPSKLKTIAIGSDEFVSLVYSDIRDKRAVRRTVSIPKWMDDRVAESGLSLSRVLQDALLERVSR
jgi:predicted RNase H-like HicB family nuclease